VEEEVEGDEEVPDSVIDRLNYFHGDDFEKLYFGSSVLKVRLKFHLLFFSRNCLDVFLAVCL